MCCLCVCLCVCLEPFALDLFASRGKLSWPWNSWISGRLLWTTRCCSFKPPTGKFWLIGRRGWQRGQRRRVSRPGHALRYHFIAALLERVTAFPQKRLSRGRALVLMMPALKLKVLQIYAPNSWYPVVIKNVTIRCETNEDRLATL